MSLVKRFKSIMFVLALVVWANHCILSDALASPKSNTVKQSHCHGEEGPSGQDDNQGGTDHHSKCSDSGCCQPALQSADASSLAAPGVFGDLAILFQNLEIQVQTFTPSQLSKFIGTGPPDTPSILISALYSAPNAPPVSSKYF